MSEPTSPDVPVALPYQSPTAAPPQVVVWLRLVIVVLAGVAIERGIEVLGFAITYIGNNRPPVGGGLLPVFALLPMLVSLGLCWLAWNKAPKLALKLTDGSDWPASSGLEWSLLLPLGLVLLGVYELIEGAVSFTGFVASTVGQALHYRIATEGWLPPLVRVVAGLWLVLGTNGIRRIVGQYSGRWKDEPPQP